MMYLVSHMIYMEESDICQAPLVLKVYQQSQSNSYVSEERSAALLVLHVDSLCQVTRLWPCEFLIYRVQFCP